MKSSHQRWYWFWAALCALLLFVAVLAYVGWTIAGSNLGKAGEAPGLAVAGELPSTRMRTMEQWCTGVVTTRGDVWLVGRNELRSGSDRELAHIPADAIRLGGAHDDVPARRGLFGRTAHLTTLARLQDDGSFQVVAVVPDIACLVVSPQSETLYLFTWMRPPEPPEDVAGDGRRRVKQDMVFRSADAGRTWEWLEDGFMASATRLGSSLRPVFASDQDVWLWGDSPDRSRRTHGDGADTAPRARVATSLFHSPDAGRTAARIYSDHELEPSAEELLSLTDMPDVDAIQRASQDDKRFVTQVDNRRAYAWIAWSAWYRDAEGESRRVRLTTRADLVRSSGDEPWRVARVTREPGTLVRHVITAASGRSHAIVADEQGEWLARLDPETGQWAERHPVPRLLPGWLAEQAMGVRYFWSNGERQVISLWGDVVVPRLLFPFTEEPAAISTDAHFHTSDGGRSWRQLAIPGYLGVMGLGTRGDDLFWTKGNWYSNDEPYVWRYRLSQ